MSAEPKISCICITHNRVEMLKRALQCFEAQTYFNKELVVLFENDPITAEFIANNSRYGYSELHEENVQHMAYVMESEHGDSCPLEEGCKVSIKNKDGVSLTNRQGTFGFVGNNSEFNVVVVNFQTNTFFLKYGDQWVNISDDGAVTVSSSLSHAQQYSFSHHLDGVFELRLTQSPFAHESLERIGWKKKTIREARESPIVFHNIFAQKKMSLGMKRNLSIRAAQGDYICVWDDDDWYAETRIQYQMAFLQFTRKQACSLAYTILFDQNTQRAYHNSSRATGHENSLLFKKDGTGRYGNLNAKEDTPLLISFYNKNQLAVMEDPELYIYNYHKRNTSSSGHFKTVITGSSILDEGQGLKIKEILTLPSNN